MYNISKYHGLGEILFALDSPFIEEDSRSGPTNLNRTKGRTEI